LKLKNETGFTLVELSIVIVIIGLIVAGVVGGQTLVRQAKVRALVSDYNKQIAAINAFRLEYDGIPGDFDNAAAYGIGTSGNGDKNVTPYNSEMIYAWAHLSGAKLIPGAYTGATAGNPFNQIGVNIPESSYGNGIAIYMSHIGITSNCLQTGASPLFGRVDDVNVLTFARPETTGNLGCPRVGFLKVSEAHGIDVKMDDGEADSGIMYSANTLATNTPGARCVDSAVGGTGGANYDFTDQGENCRILFKF